MRSLLVFVLAAGIGIVRADRATATAHLNVRTGPGMKFEKLWVAQPGTGFPILGRDGRWLKVQVIQYRPTLCAGFYADTAAASAAPQDSIEVTQLSQDGKKLATEFLPRSQLVRAGSNLVRTETGAYFKVYVLRVGWVFAGYTSEPTYTSRPYSTEGKVGFTLPDPPKEVQLLPWGQLKGKRPLFLALSSPRSIGSLDSGAVVQVLGDEKGFLKVQVSSSDLKDTLYVDLNQYYDANGGDTATLVSGRHDSIGTLGPIRKDLLHFEPNRAFFGPGISRLVPVEVDLPLLVDAAAVDRFHAYTDLARALRGRKETHPRSYFPKADADALVRLVRQDLESVVAPKWFVQGGDGPFTFGLVLKTVAMREAGRNPEEYLFHKFVRPVLDQYLKGLTALAPFRELAFEIEYMEPGIGGSGLRFKTLSFRLDVASLSQVLAGTMTYRTLFEGAQISRKEGNS